MTLTAVVGSQPHDGGATTKEWDAFVDASEGVDVQQSSAWARVKAPGHVSHRAVIRNQEGGIVAGAQMLTRTFGRMVRVGYVPLGPIATSEVHAAEVLDLLEEMGRAEGLAAILVQPARSGRLHMGATLEERGYRRSSTDVATSATVELPLDADLAVIRKAYNRSRRKNLKSARRYGVEVRITGPEGVDVFHDLHVASAARNNFSPMSRAYLDRQCAELGVGRHIQIALAEIDGDPLAAGLFTTFNGRIDFKLTGWKPTDVSRAACPNDAIQDVMIEWANENGQSVFDLGGLPRSHALALLGLEGDPSMIKGTGTEFKTAWGGEVKLYEPTYERILRPLGHVTYRLPAAALADQGVGGRVVNWLRRS